MASVSDAEPFSKGPTELSATNAKPNVASQPGWVLLPVPRYNPDEHRQTSNISRSLVGNKLADRSDAPVGAAPTTSSFST